MGQKISIQQMETDHKSKNNNGQKGQSTVEFLMTFAFTFGFCILFISHAFNMARGYVLHYANFMASRTFLSVDVASPQGIGSSLQAAQAAAEDTFNRIPLQEVGINAQFEVYKPTQNAPSALMSGTTATTESKLSQYNFFGGENKLILHSESFLSKEPVRFTCHDMTCKAMGLSGCSDAMDITLYDNGC